MEKKVYIIILFVIFSIFINIPMSNASFFRQALEDMDSETKDKIISEVQGGNGKTIAQPEQPASSDTSDSEKINPTDWNPWSSLNDAEIPQTLSDKIGPIVKGIQNIGVAISVIVLMIIGFKTMTGSIEEKSAYKESLSGYIIGIILVLSMTTIPNIIYTIMKP